MARKTRIEFEGAFYHVITRGNQRQIIFKNDEDYLSYCSFLSHYKEKYGFFLYAYVLMNNHVHLLIERHKVPISKIMQGINQRYTIYFNKKYGTVGHLFQGRYKAILCDRDEYMLSLVKYIHLNPVRAAIVGTPDEYRWCSHQIYKNRSTKVTLVDTDLVLHMFSDEKGAARRLYNAYMEQTGIIKKEDIYCTVDQRILGDEQFVEHAQKKGAQIKVKKREREFSLEQISTAIERVQGISLQDLRTAAKSRSITKAKQLLCIVAREYGYKGREIASFIRKDPALVTRYCKLKESLTKDAERVIRQIRQANVNSQV